MDQRIQRLIAELFLPIAGVFFWQWNTAFLLWFVLLDGITGLVVGRIHPVRRSPWEHTLLQCGECVLAALLIFALSDSFTDSFFKFFFYEDTGIPQGYFLLPMIVLGEWIKWKTSKKIGVYCFQPLKAIYAKIAFFGLLFVLGAVGIQDFYLSLTLIFLTALVILFVPQDVLVI
ncbi:MAG: hypothetical protein RL432_61 [Bacteroidota bacterium]|jgi:hypothetical protein